MEIVRKKICANDFVRRDFGQSPNVNEGEMKWGGYAKDYIVRSDDGLGTFKDSIPLIQNGNDLILRYWNAMRFYRWLYYFAQNTRFYELCLRKGEKMWVENSADFFSLDYEDGLYDTLPDIDDEWAVGTKKIRVNDNAIEFLERFGADSGATSEELNDIYTFCINFNSVVKENFTKNSGENNYADPYVDLKLLISSDYADCGLLQPYTEEWQSEKEYFVGDIVYKEDLNAFFKLKEGVAVKKIKCPVEYCDIIVDPENHWTVVDGTTVNESDVLTIIDENYYEIINGDVYIVIGMYNLATFEEQYWEMCQCIETGTTVEIESTSNSRLSDFVRTKRSYDNDGNVLPYVLNQEDNEAELIYLIGVKRNSTKLDDETEIASEIIKAEISEDTAYTENYLVIEDGTAAPAPSIPDSGKIRFTYLIDATFSGDTIIDSGITYIDEYDYVTSYIEGDTVKYIKIDYEGAKIYGEDGVGIIPAEIIYTIKCEDQNGAFPLDGHTYSDERTFGVHNINLPTEEELENMTIERGTAALFEKMDFLGGMRSVEEMESFRNDFFSVKK